MCRRNRHRSRFVLRGTASAKHGDAEVGKRRAAGRCDQYIRRLDVTVQHPGLMADRVKFGKSDVKRWDKILSPLMSFSVGFPMVIVAGLDHRFSWTTPFALWVNLVGLLLVGLGYAVAIWAMIVNSFFSTVVRIQKERGHVVCDTGPYRIIRHPGYAGNLLALFGIVMALDSLWALIPAIAALVIVLIRTPLEDQTLRAELPGYREYTCRVRYRLFPGIY